MGVTKKILREGNGPTPTKGQKIDTHVTGYVAGPQRKKFWSTKDPGQNIFSFTVGIGQVIKGWDEGFLSVKEGESAELTMTSDYGYGPNGFPAWGIPGGATLIFEVELLKIHQ